ncbi:alpha/beta hydrolase [soil metagenome]
MSLDPQARALLDLQALANFPGFHRMAPAEARSAFRARRSLAGPAEEVGGVEDRELPGGLRVRVYWPKAQKSLSDLWPAMVFFHGGGFVQGDLDTIDSPCRTLTNASRCLFVSVDYRLAPEHKFPAAVEDAYTATSWVAEKAAGLGIDPARIAVGGDSAGGNLAIVTALLARDRGGPRLAFQLLIYPVTNHAFDTPSYRECGDGYGLNREAMEYYWTQYLDRPEDGANPLASPLLADLHGLPPAMVITAEYDPLRDEGEALAEKLRTAGVAVEARRYEGQIHGFFTMAGLLEASRQLHRDIAKALRQALA